VEGGRKFTLRAKQRSNNRVKKEEVEAPAPLTLSSPSRNLTVKRRVRITAPREPFSFQVLSHSQGYHTHS
jgi:hypothetical protein